MGAKTVPADVRELLAVVGLGLAGLVLAGVVAFTPWYDPAGAEVSVTELRGPAAPAAVQP